MQVQWRLHLHISFAFFSKNCGSHTSLATPKPVLKYVQVKIHVPMHAYIALPAYNNSRIRLQGHKQTCPPTVTHPHFFQLFPI